MYQLTQAAAARLVRDFEWLHAHPELSYEETETTAFLRAALSEAGVTILPYAMETGLVAEIVGTKPAAGVPPVIALRADIDALPVQEACDIAYASKAPGKMHACGHDFHAAVQLCAARLLQEQRTAFSGTVRLIFQPAEESSLGAMKILETPALEKVGAIFALHTSPLYRAGEIAVRAGAVTASVDRFSVTFTGRGTHAAYPEKGIDPIVAAASFIGAAQTVVSRNVDPMDAALVSVTHVQAGNTWNVIPETAFLEGTVRTLSKPDRALIPQRLAQIAVGIAQAAGASAEFRWQPGPPPTDNDPRLSELALETARACGLPALADEPSMLGEDFAFFQEKVPGVYIHAGIGLTAPNHNPKFQVDEASLAPAAEYYAALAVSALEKLGE